MLSSPLQRPRQVMGAAAALIAALLMAALSLTGASSASAATTICGRTDSVKIQGGKYVVQNNEWGDSIPQCIDVTDNGFNVTTGYHNVGSGGAPAAYPSVYAGCHYGNCSTGNGLPLRVSSFGNPQSSVNFTTTGGSWDAAYDIWFDTSPNPGGQNNGEELMIWANHSGPPAPFGSKVGTVSIEGANWDVWYGRQGSGIAWNVVSYVRQQPTNAITVNIKDFTDDSARRGYLQPSWYMTSVQFGFEPWVGGPGLAVNSFSYDSNGSAGSGGGTTGGGTGGNNGGAGGAIHGLAGKCVDVAGANSANGTAVQLYDCNGTAAQSWSVNADGSLRALGKCMDVTAAGTADGTKVQLYDCNGTNAQKWTASGGHLVNTGSGKCLDATEASSANGTRLQIWSCGAGANQQWTLPS